MSVKRVRDRVHAAADLIDVPPVDVDAVVGKARSSRPRRPGRLVLAAAVAVVVGVVGGVVWRSGVLEPADTSPAPATPEALAAVALEHIDSEPSAFELLYEPPEGTVGVDMRFNPGPAEDGELVRVSVAPGRAPKGFCRFAAGCETIATDAGDVRLRWEEEVVGQDPGLFSLLLQTENEYRLILYSGVGIPGDPRGLDLEVPVDDLVDVITDERFGLTTTQEMVDTRLEGFPDPRPPPEPKAAMSAKAIAGEVLPNLRKRVVSARAAGSGELAEYRAYETGDRRSWGTVMQLRDGAALSIIVVPEPRAAIVRCPGPEWRCWTVPTGATRSTAGRQVVVTRRQRFAIVTTYARAGVTSETPWQDALLYDHGFFLVRQQKSLAAYERQAKPIWKPR